MVQTMSSQSRVSSYLTAAQAAPLLGVSKWTVYRLIAAGLLVALRVGRQWRISPEDIEAYRRANRNVPLAA